MSKQIERPEKEIVKTISNPIVPIYEWMYDIGLNSTQLLVYAILFDGLKDNCLQEKVFSSRELAKKLGITQAQFNLVCRQLNKHGLIYRRKEGKGCMTKTYYSLYENLLNTTTES